MPHGPWETPGTDPEAVTSFPISFFPSLPDEVRGPGFQTPTPTPAHVLAVYPAGCCHLPRPPDVFHNTELQKRQILFQRRWGKVSTRQRTWLTDLFLSFPGAK